MHLRVLIYSVKRNAIKKTNHYYLKTYDMTHCNSTGIFIDIIDDQFSVVLNFAPKLIRILFHIKDGLFKVHFHHSSWNKNQTFDNWITPSD